jgi:ectoine hydroxylase-related dioxygenase (phytanoyl-CoA dioxygenase family)
MSSFEQDGFHRVPGILSREEVDAWRDKVERILGSSADTEHGRRNLFQVDPMFGKFARHEGILASLVDILGPNIRAVKATYFDKTPGKNWKVSWHQDLMIAVSGRREAPGFGPWSIKEGVHYVSPPVEVLESMVAVRIHLDDCPEENGALKVIPGSHRHGKLSPENILLLKEQGPIKVCAAKAGDALLMRPLLIHSSSPAMNPAHRRVMHFEFSSMVELPEGLSWV